MQSQFVCPDCGRSFRADANAATVLCPNRRECGGEIDVKALTRSSESASEGDAPRGPGQIRRGSEKSLGAPPTWRTRRRS